MYTAKKNKDKISYISENLDLYEDFYGLFYNLNFPIYMMKKKNKKTISKFITGFKWIKNEVMFRHNVYLSICNKFIEKNQKGRAQNKLKNTRSARYFVIDIDSDYIISQESAFKIINAFKCLNFFDYCPLPTAIVASGCGFHFYYAIDEIYFKKTSQFSTDTEYKKWQEEKESLFGDTAEIVRKSIAKALANTTELIKNKTFLEDKILETLKVDDAVKAQTQQVIRAPGSYNAKVEEYCIILELNKSCKYTLTQLLQDYRPKSEKIEGTNLLEFRKNGIYTNEETVRLNKKRLEDMQKLLEIRKETGSLIGSRQNLMSNYAWLLINTNENLEKDKQLDIHKELLSFGKKIGGEFATEKYCKDKIKHVETYHKRKRAISNKAMTKFLGITEDEMKELTAIKPNREALRNQKRLEKQNKRDKAKELKEQGYSITEIAKEIEVSRPTIYNWFK